jgi:Putative zincin peptidase
MRATNHLPDNYHHRRTLDLSSSRSILWMNLAALPLLIIFGWLFSLLINIFRSFNLFQTGILGFFTEFSIGELGAFVLSIIFMLILHELVHGIFFWAFTLERPKFALRSGYAFATAPNWYLPSSKYILVGLSPFLVISAASIIFAWFVAYPLIPYLLVIATFNAAGSLGDLIVVGWVLNQPISILVKDEGTKFSSFLPD